MNNTNVLNRIRDYGWPTHKFLSIHLERQGKTSTIFSSCRDTFASPFLPEELQGTSVYLGLSHCFHSTVPEHLAYLINWPTSLSGPQFRNFTCSCHKNLAALLNVLPDSRWGSGCCSDPTGQLSSLGSLLSWTITHTSSAGVLVGLERYGDIRWHQSNLRLSSYLEVWTNATDLHCA